MISVTVDVTGFYFEETVMVEDDASVLDVMTAVKTMTAGRRNGAMLDFNTEGPSPDELFLDGIRVTHRGGSAKSRQIRPDAQPYPDGVYEFYDDDVAVVDGRLKPRRDNGLFFVHAWQYYVYDQNRVDLNRLQALQPAPGTDRKIVPFSRKPATGGLQLGNNYLIVWRLVAIALMPSSGDSLKMSLRKMYRNDRNA